MVSSLPYSSLDSLDSVIRIYRNVEYAAKKLVIAKSMIVESCNTNTGLLDGMYYKSLSNLPFTTPREPPTISHDTKTIPISIFTTGGIYPSDSATVDKDVREVLRYKYFLMDHVMTSFNFFVTFIMLLNHVLVNMCPLRYRMKVVS